MCTKKFWKKICKTEKLANFVPFSVITVMIYGSQADLSRQSLQTCQLFMGNMIFSSLLHQKIIKVPWVVHVDMVSL